MTGRADGGQWRLLTVVPWVVVGVVMVVLAGVAVVRLFVSEPGASTEPVTVAAVADLAVTATEDLDVAAGVEMLCDQPIDLYRMAVESTITRWQTESGVQVPEVDAVVSDVDEGATGSFVIDIDSDQEGLEDEQQTFRVFVESRAGRSCVTGVGGPRSTRATTRFAGKGYSGVTSPPPVPRASTSSTP